MRERENVRYMITRQVLLFLTFPVRRVPQVYQWQSPEVAAGVPCGSESGGGRGG